MMKKMIATALVATTLLTGVLSPSAEAAQVKIVRSDMPIEVLYDARKIIFDVKPKMVSGSVLVPIRFVSDKLGGQLTVNGKDITIVKGNRTLKLTMNSKAASFNGTPVTLAQPAMVEKGRTLVPLRAVSEGLGTAVEWDGVNKFVWIGSKEIPDIHDAVPAEDFSPYLPYYKGHEYYSQKLGVTRTKAHIVKDSDLPIKIRSYNIYRIDKSFDNKGDAYLRFSTTFTGSFGFGTVTFLKKEDFKAKQEASYLLESLDNKLRIRYVSLHDVYDRKKTVDLNKTDYFGIPEDLEGAVLFKNKWRS